MATGSEFTEGPLWHPEGYLLFVDNRRNLIFRLPEIPANCAWGGPENRNMFFTASTSVYRMEMKTPGTRVPRAA